jgi:hypothetical protein
MPGAAAVARSHMGGKNRVKRVSKPSVKRGSNSAVAVKTGVTAGYDRATVRRGGLNTRI